MPEFSESVTGVYVGRETMNKHERENNPIFALKVPREPVYIRDKSKEKQAYVYNASPYSHQQPSGSTGTFYIPGLAKDKVLGADLCVAGPLIVPGLPSETIPKGDNKAERIYHEPMEGRPNADKPGFHFAMEIIGAGGLGVQPESNLSRQGVFVSEFRGYNPVPAMVVSDKFIRETIAHYGLAFPKLDSIEEVAESLHRQAKTLYKKFCDGPFYREWVDMVREAQAQFRQHCARKCEHANAMYSQNQFHQVRDEVLYDLARYIGKTEVECPWLVNSGDSANNVGCWACGKIIKAKYKCPECGALQVTQAEYDAEVARRAGGKTAA